MNQEKMDKLIELMEKKRQDELLSDVFNKKEGFLSYLTSFSGVFVVLVSLFATSVSGYIYIKESLSSLFQKQEVVILQTKKNEEKIQELEAEIKELFKIIYIGDKNAK